MSARVKKLTATSYPRKAAVVTRTIYGPGDEARVFAGRVLWLSSCPVVLAASGGCGISCMTGAAPDPG